MRQERFNLKVMSIKKDYKLYVFDLDGTLIDTKVDIGRALQSVIKDKKGGEMSLELLMASIGRGAKETLQNLSGLAGPELDERLIEFKSMYDKVCTDNTVIYEGGEELLHRLKENGALLALITMKSKIPTHKILKAHGLFDIFDDVISFDDVEARKPDPESMLMLLEKHNLRPEDAIMIGDTVTDIRFAKAAEVDVCAMTYGYGITEELLEEKPEYTLNSFNNF